MEKRKKSKQEKGRIFTRLIALILVGLMILSVGTSLVYSLI